MNTERSQPISSAALACLLAASSVLVSCGTGGEGDAGLTGTLLGGPVSGVSFETETHSGVTAADGTFRYEEGEIIRFFIGDTLLGETEAKEEVSPFDLVPNAVPLKGDDTISRAASNECDPFVPVINMTAFLATLDQDDDLDNGINITGDVSALFEGVAIDFAQNIFGFRRDHALRTVLSQANGQGLFESHRQVRSGAFAMQRLYATLGLDAGLFVFTVFERDGDADGVIDSRNESQYDERAQLVSSSRDADGDGVLDSTSTSEYDAHGRRVRREFDSDGDGSPNRITRTVYNDDGDPTRTESDSDGDGDVDSVTTTSYDDIGRALRDESDGDNSGTPDRIVTYWYDDDANQRGSREDEGADGSIDRSTISFLDENGDLIRTEADIGDDGTVNSRNTFERDARGDVTRRESDRDGDGQLDDIDLTEYNEMCLRTYDEAQEGDGTVERTTTTTYDDVGRRLSRSTDSDADGIPDSIDTYQYDESGNLVFSATDSDGDGTPDSTTTYEYVDGARSRGASDREADGPPHPKDHHTSEATKGWVYVLNN